MICNADRHVIVAVSPRNFVEAPTKRLLIRMLADEVIDLRPLEKL